MSPSASTAATTFERLRALRDSHTAPGLAQRRARLAALASMLRENVGAWCEAVDRDFSGRASQETRLLEIFPTLAAIGHARRHLRGWMKPQRVATGLWFLPGQSRVMPQPLGVVGIVVPWNYPIYLAAGPLVAALAAGNRAMVKMSESAPATGALFARLAERYLGSDVVAVVNGDATIAREFTALPFDHLLFTGSTAVGRQVMRTAAENLTPVTLELGGKSPAIVGRGFDIAQAADRILFGKCVNAGQTCIAPDYVLVPEERVEAFVAGARAAVARLYPSLRDNPDYSAIIDARHRERLAGYLAEARSHGAQVVELDAAGEDFSGSPKMAPALVLGARDSDRILREEIFGPLLPVIGYRELDEAIAYVNARPRPLALYVFDHDRASVERVLERTTSGGVTVNDTLLHIAQEELPFGGVGASGMGEYHGRAGFDAFSKRKAVFRQSRFNGLRLLQPPYGARVERVLRLLLR